MFNFSDFKIVSAKLRAGAAARMTDEKIIVREIHSFLNSQKRKDMITGNAYFDGDHDILRRKRTVIGRDGDVEEVTNLPNNRIVDNKYGKHVMHKVNYLVGKPFTIQCENEQYLDIVKDYMDEDFLETVQELCYDVLNCGIAYLFPRYNEEGRFVIDRFEPTEIIPQWSDRKHKKLESFIRTYEVTVYDGEKEKKIRKVEVYSLDGISFFEMTEKDELIPEGHEPYFTIGEDEFNWDKIPLIVLKYNLREIPLITKVKSIQDGINLIESNFQNGMEEDPRNTIMVLVNYDGENLGEFRRNLATYGAVKVRSVDGTGGDVRTLQVEVNSENYKTILSIFKNALVEGMLSFDAKDDRLGNNPNQMNIQSMYSDIDLDANGMESSLQRAFKSVLWFLDMHLFNTHVGDFENEDVTFTFNRNILINEAEKIENIQKSVGILSKETLVANHPWVDDPQAELEKLEAEEQKQIEQFGFNPMLNGGEEDDEEE